MESKDVKRKTLYYLKTIIRKPTQGRGTFIGDRRGKIGTFYWYRYVLLLYLVTEGRSHEFT